MIAKFTEMGATPFRGHAAAVFTIFVWGTTFVSTKVLLRSFSPIEILFFRFMIGYFFLWAICPRALRVGGPREELYFALAGFCGVTLYYLLENIALVYSLASVVGIILSIAPFLTAILAHWTLDGERLTPRFFLGFATAITGIALIAFNGNFVLKTNPLGDVLAFLAAVAWAFYSILTRKIGAFGYNTILCTRRIFFYGLLFMLPALYAMDFRLELARFANPVNALNIAFLGFGASAICFVTWNWALKVLGAVRTSAYIYAVPVINIVAAVIVLGERVTSFMAAGTVLALAGLVISESKPRKHAQSEA